MRLAHGLILLLWLCLLASSGLAEAPSTPSYQVIVNATNGVGSVERKFLSDAFLKKTTRWGNGDVIRPVDQSAISDVRRKFSEHILNRSVTAVRSYWQQVIFSGRDVPPPELASDAEVVEYVSRHSGAVGYVSGAASTSGAKVISVR
jgi:ABC-type phosphate transport system substrate-binding protein